MYSQKRTSVNSTEGEVFIGSSVGVSQRSTVGRDKARPALSKQILLTFACSVIHLGIGCILSFSGVTLPQLIKMESDDQSTSNETESENVFLFEEDANATQTSGGIPVSTPVSPASLQTDYFSHLVLTQEEAAVFSSIPVLAAAGSSVLGSILVAVVDHKTVLLFTLPLTALTWVSISLAPNATVLIAARVVQGLGLGIIGGIATIVYVVEVAHYSVRGPLSAALDMTRNAGILFMFSIGATQLWWRYQATLVGLITTLPPLVLLFFLPTSPRWLAAHGKIELATEALQFYRGADHDITEELDQIKSIAEDPTSPLKALWKQVIFVTQPKTAITLASLSVFVSMNQFTGQLPIIAYAVPVLQRMSPDINPYIGVVLLGICRVIGCTIFLSTSKYFGRIKMYLGSMLITSASLALLGALIYLQETDRAPSWTWWIPLTTLLIYMTSTTTAIPICFLHTTELLPVRCRALGFGIIDIFLFGTTFAITQTFPSMTVAFHLYGVLWFYAICALLVAWVPLLCYPETHGKHLEAIETEFDKKSKRTKKLLMRRWKRKQTL